MKATFALAAIVAAFLPSLASAQVVLTDRAAFQAQGVGTNYTYNFNTAGTDDFQAPFTVASQGSGTAFAYSTAAESSVDNTRYLDVRLNPSASPTRFLTVSSTVSFTSFGFDINSYGTTAGSGSDFGETVTYLGSNGQTGTFLTPGTNTSEFRGIVFTAPVTSISFRATAGLAGGDNLTYFGVDNVTIFAPGVPEPAAWTLMIAGFGAVGGTLRRRRRTVESSSAAA